MTTLNSPSSFSSHLEKVDEKIIQSLFDFGEKTKLRDACEYALMSGGKRFRPLIVILVAEALNNHLDVSDAALAVEFFHTASLIVDDLPCMDDDDQRRDKPSTHKIYGESTALLASYSLMTAGFGKIHKNAEVIKKSFPPFSALSDVICTLALSIATQCSGILGATGGQFFDLFPPDNSLETAQRIISQKTGALFEISFAFGWLFGGGDMKQLKLVKKLAHHFGFAFQIADDLHDIKQDEQENLKLSIVHMLGPEKALEYFQNELFRCCEYLKKLGLFTPSFERIIDMLFHYARFEK
ncbi:polyprenyl synthetase family protein [Candidatus Rhabdochlamydia porcellionis]|jgi:geranylgeranyl diphosphate synthase, type II|uniref:Polyprenyl synthetase n=1 Tax=Candidatus Rhabdochlamydia porcellionis TaxID=225148 RepID=A0ABX8Z3G9_9BACT|nr:polyprenyl synthetase family protein [Candidatus Rhabdochlamydia porcellionis]QZA59453.1 Polyprenyl synthetase [Candidatus Rhabdochlamydia porcellionis]